MKIIQQPTTEKKNVKDILHGVEIIDSYRWLEDVPSKSVQAWLDKENIYTRSILDPLPKREELKNEFEKLFREETIGFPKPKNVHYFFVKRNADEDLGVLYVKKGLTGEPRVLVNPNQISKEKGFAVNLYGYSVSKDASLISYGLSEAANDAASMYVMDVATGKNLLDIIPGKFYPEDSSWNIDNTGFWYTRRKEEVPKGEEKFHKKIYYHKLGKKFSEDKLIFGDEYAKENVPSAGSTFDGNYLMITMYILSEKYRRSDIYLLDLHNQQAGFIPIVKDVKANEDLSFSSRIHRGFVYIAHDYKAPNGKIDRVAIPNISKGMSAWETVVPENKNGVIKNFSVSSDKLFVLTLENVHSVLREYSLIGELKREIPFPTIGSSNRVIAEPEGKEGFFSFSSFIYPQTIFRIDFLTDEISIYDKQKVSIDTSDIVSEQKWFISKDGTRIPIFLIHKKSLEKTGVIPTVLYGYGGFGISQTPCYMKKIIPLVTRGGMFAIANIRGGGEFGEKWHEASTKNKKQNGFDDFISAGEWLIQNKYTNSEHLAISGESNGGLLVGAVMTQRPELFKAVIMSAPVADMLRYHLFHGGRHWISEYGSAEDPEMFQYLLGYSPYQNIKNGVKYPATMIVTADQDDRVHPGQAFKMTARLQEANTSDNPIIIRVERQAGHNGAIDLSRYIDKAIDEWSFIFSEIGDSFSKK